eukprot:tig00021728_g23302.t1
MVRQAALAECGLLDTMIKAASGAQVPAAALAPLAPGRPKDRGTPPLRPTGVAAAGLACLALAHAAPGAGEAGARQMLEAHLLAAALDLLPADDEFFTGHDEVTAASVLALVCGLARAAAEAGPAAGLRRKASFALVSRGAGPAHFAPEDDEDARSSSSRSLSGLFNRSRTRAQAAQADDGRALLVRPRPALRPLLSLLPV